MTPHQHARAWRLARGLTVAELADLTGFSRESITCFERGTQGLRRGERKRRPVNSYAFHRYTMACAGVEAELCCGCKFQWVSNKRDGA